MESVLLTGRRWKRALKYQLYHSTSFLENKVITAPHIAWCWRVCHLQIYQTSEAQILWFSPTAAAVKASFQSHLSHFSLLSSGANPHPHPVLMLKGDCSLLEEWEGERWWAAYLWEGLALLKWNSLVLSDRAMEVEERRGPGGQRRGPTLCEARPWGSEAPLLCVLLPSILHFHLSFSPHLLPSRSPLSSGLLSHHHRGPEQADLSAVRQEICPEALRWAAKYRGWTVGEQKTLKKHIRKAGTLVKCV